MSHWRIIHGTQENFYYLTATIVDWTYVFTSQSYFQIVVESLVHCQREKDLRVAGYVIMPNHLHLICAGSEKHALANTIRDFKRYTASRILDEAKNDHRRDLLEVFKQAATNAGRGNDHKVWIEGNHPVLLDYEEIFRVKLNYMHDNPVRKGYVEKPEHWMYSSARNYVLGDHSILRVELVV